MKALKKIHVLTGIVGMVFLYYLLCLPDQLFSDPHSKVLYASDGTLLNAKTATDGQWRFPSSGTVPEKFAKALIAFEDKRFYDHPGVDLMGLGRAFIQNIKEKKVVSGGSTLTMQLMRMARGGQARSVGQKIIETIWATRAEIRYSKSEILQKYADHAPYGGNVVGLEAASWRYFGKSSEALTWAESCMLAVLPNAPALIHPGKNRPLLLCKRDRLLKKLYLKGSIDSFTYQASILEPIPEKPKRLPNLAYHYAHRKDSVENGLSDLQGQWQQAAFRILKDHHAAFRQKGIHNAAIIVQENKSGKTVIYHGNTPGSDHENRVDMVVAARSSGSILKPLLYGLAMEEGIIYPSQLLPDIPTNIAGFNPKNYNKEYYGAIPAAEALSKSLNVPMVYLLKEYGVDRFKQKLKKLGITTLNRASGDYGLSLILGGGEVALEELVRVYSAMARQLLDYENFHGIAGYKKKKEAMSAGSIYKVFDAMKEVQRPNDDGYWERFSSSFPIAWKTGTSYGHRDAWAIGINRDYTVGVWVGNADGEGHREIVGSTAAGTLMFSVWNILPRTHQWFAAPHDALRSQSTCKLSGHASSHRCPDKEIELVPVSEITVATCPYHHSLTLTIDRKYQTYAYEELSTIDTSWFLLPPSMAYYYKKHHPEYAEAPLRKPMKKATASQENEKINLLFPAEEETIYLPSGLDGQKMDYIAQAVASKSSPMLYWHLDGNYLGETKTFHQLKVSFLPGKHHLMVMDENGNKKRRTFTVIGRKDGSD